MTGKRKTTYFTVVNKRTGRMLTCQVLKLQKIVLCITCPAVVHVPPRYLYVVKRSDKESYYECLRTGVVVYAYMSIANGGDKVGDSGVAPATLPT